MQNGDFKFYREGTVLYRGVYYVLIMLDNCGIVMRGSDYNVFIDYYGENSVTRNDFADFCNRCTPFDDREAWIVAMRLNYVDAFPGVPLSNYQGRKICFHWYDIDQWDGDWIEMSDVWEKSAYLSMFGGAR